MKAEVISMHGNEESPFLELTIRIKKSVPNGKRVNELWLKKEIRL